MHILHIASGDLWAGAEVQISTLLKQLVKSGNKVNAILLNEGRLADELSSSGIYVSVIPESENGLFALTKKIKSKLAELQPDVIHTHRQKEHIVGSIANFMSTRVPCVRTVHGSTEFSLSLKQRVQTGLDRFCGRFLQQAIVSVDAELTEKLSKHFKQSKIYTIPNGIDVEETVNKAQSNVPEIDESFKHIGIVGRLEPVKRVDLFLLMAKHLIESGEQSFACHFHIFGSGKLEAELRQQANRLAIENRVTFHGHTEEIQSWIQKMDVVVMTSDHEGLPMTSLECLALGTPLVAHAVGGLVPLLTNAFPHGLVQRHNPQDYAQVTNEVLKLSEQVSLPSEYNASENARKIAALYQSLIDD